MVRTNICIIYYIKKTKGVAKAGIETRCRVTCHVLRANSIEGVDTRTFGTFSRGICVVI